MGEGGTLADARAEEKGNLRNGAENGGRAQSIILAPKMVTAVPGRAQSCPLTPNPMNQSKTIVCLLTLAAALCLGASAVAETKPKAKELFDFTTQSVERDGVETVRVIKKYGYSFGDWQDKIVFVEKRGLLVPYLKSKGGFGGDKQLKLGEFNAIEVLALIGNRNEAAAFGVTLIDADGTEATWNLALAGKPRGADLVYRLELAKCDKEDKPGKAPGLDKTKIKKWQIKGNWQDAKTEVLVAKLTAVE